MFRLNDSSFLVCRSFVISTATNKHLLQLICSSIHFVSHLKFIDSIGIANWTNPFKQKCSHLRWFDLNIVRCHLNWNWKMRHEKAFASIERDARSDLNALNELGDKFKSNNTPTIIITFRGWAFCRNPMDQMDALWIMIDFEVRKQRSQSHPAARRRWWMEGNCHRHFFFRPERRASQLGRALRRKLHFRL